MSEDLAPIDGGQQAQAASAHQAQEEIKRTCAVLAVGWLRLSEQLYQFHALRQWKALGYKSLEEWLADPEIDVERRQAFYLIASWRELVIERNVDPRDIEGIDVTKVRDVLPAIKAGQVTAQEALADARTLERRDLQERYNTMGRNGTVGPDNTLEATNEPERFQCEACGSWVRRAAA